MTDPTEKIRLDKWLWAARFFKTRSAAAAAVDGGKVEVNGARAKPSKALNVGDRLRIRVGAFEYAVSIRELSLRRGPAAEAATLYEESEESRAGRHETAERLRAERLAGAIPRGRPTKRARRQIMDWKGR
jgi:ribosome-associated heat shock protein Hsp15